MSDAVHEVLAEVYYKRETMLTTSVITGLYSLYLGFFVLALWATQHDRPSPFQLAQRSITLLMFAFASI
jgi:hypothetical protein